MPKDFIEDFQMRVKVCTFSVKDVIDVWVWFVLHSLEDTNHPGLKNICSWLDSHWEGAAFKKSKHGYNSEELFGFVGERDG